MKAKGADIIAFFNDWPMGPNVYMEETPFSYAENGVLCVTADGWTPGAAVDPAETYDFDCGMLGWQGDEDCPAGFNDDMVKAFQKWKRDRDYVVLTVQVPKAEESAFLEVMKAKKWKVQ